MRGSKDLRCLRKGHGSETAALTRDDGNHLRELPRSGRCWEGTQNQQVTSSKRRSGKVKEGGDTVHTSCPGPRVLPRGSILTEQCAHRQEGSRVRTTGQRQPGNSSSASNPRLGAPRQGGPPGPPHLLSSTRAPLPVKSLPLWARVSLDRSLLSVRQEPSLGP